MWKLIYCSVLVFEILVAGSHVEGQKELPRTHPKYKTAKGVFDRLVRSIGDGRTKPRFFVRPSDVPGRMRVAWFDPKKNAIGLEEDTYDLCVSLGADSLNALSFLMGHELAHYYKDHGWIGDFGSGFTDLEVGQEMKALRRDLSKLTEIETEADYFGGFFGYVAGYETLNAADRVLDQIYSTYGLDENLKGYPSLSDRKIIADRSREDLKALIPVFDAGNALLLLGNYIEAAGCFDHIAKSFPSREILNNAGVARALQALNLFESGEVRYAYPLEIDFASRLSMAERYRGVEDRTELRNQLLEEARDLLQQAKLKDPSYATAHVNLACVYDLLGEAEMAAAMAGKGARLAEEAGESVTRADALIVRGIAQAKGEIADEDAAREDFESATSGNPNLSAVNLSVLDGLPFDAAGARSEGSLDGGRESIAGMMAGNTDALDPPDVVSELRNFEVYSKSTDIWKGLFIDSEDRGIFVMWTVGGYTDATRKGIKIGSPLSDVEIAYGSPSRIVTSKDGNYHVYEKAEIAFLSDSNQTIQSWLIFSSEDY